MWKQGSLYKTIQSFLIYEEKTEDIGPVFKENFIFFVIDIIHYDDTFNHVPIILLNNKKWVPMVAVLQNPASYAREFIL